ncbi:unnamed protein product, partial [Callosobruchus maculatus]
MWCCCCCGGKKQRYQVDDFKKDLTKGTPILKDNTLEELKSRLEHTETG